MRFEMTEDPNQLTVIYVGCELGGKCIKSHTTLLGGKHFSFSEVHYTKNKVMRKYVLASVIVSAFLVMAI